MKIKTGDKVQIIAGKDKGKSGKVIQVFPSLGRVSVEGLNLLVKHMRARKQGEKGQKIQFPAPIQISNIQLICPKCSLPAKVGYKFLETGAGAKKSGRKVRFCKKCKEVIE